jgi:amino acid permease
MGVALSISLHWWKMYGSVGNTSRSDDDASATVHNQIDGSLRRKRHNQTNSASIQSIGTPTPPDPRPDVDDGGRTAANPESAGNRRRAAVDGVPLRQRRGNITLRKELNLISGTAVVVGLMIGSGIFITPSSILSYSQSFGLTLVLWVIGGLIALIGGLCFCELGVLIKKSGSTYTFIREGYSFRGQKPCLSMIGSLLAFLNIWSSTAIGQPTAIAIALLTFGRYICRPFFIGCSEVPIIPVKMFALSALGKSPPPPFS